MRRSIGAGPFGVFSRPGRQEIVLDFIPWSRPGMVREVATLVWEGDRAVLVGSVRFGIDGTIETAGLLQRSGHGLLPPPIS